MISLQYKTAKNKDKNTIVVNDIPSIDPTYLSLTIPAINIEKMRLAGRWVVVVVATKFSVKHQGKDIHHPPSTIYKWPFSDLPGSTLCPSLSLSFTIIVPFVTDSYTQFWYTVTKSTRIGLASKTRHLYHWWMIYLLPDMILMIQNKRAFIQNSQLPLLNFKISFPLQEPPLFIFSLNKILIKHHSNQHQFSVLRATR